MMTDEKLAAIERDIAGLDVANADVVRAFWFDQLIAQAREANALRAEVETWRETGREVAAALYDARPGNHNAITFAEGVDMLAKQLAEARQLVALLGNQLAETMKVVNAAVACSETAAAEKSEEELEERQGELEMATDAYRAWLASHPHVTYGGLVTVQPDGSVKT